MEEMYAQQSGVKSKSVWFTVTPYSKYAAMVLFIVMPFLGVWVGYYYAPSKTILIEKTIPVKKLTEANQNQSPTSLQTSSKINLSPIKDIYYEDEDQVFAYLYGGEFNDLVPLDVDKNTFEVLDSGFSRDKENLYYPANDSWIAEKAYCLDISSNTGEDCYEGSLEYSAPTIIPNADPESFTKINESYFKDNNQVYILMNPSKDAAPLVAFIIEGANPDSFEPIYQTNVKLSKDSSNVFIGNKILTGVDPNSLRLFNFSERLMADKSGVYLNGKLLDYLDAETFTVTEITESYALASDKNGDYKINVSEADGQHLTIEKN